MKWVLLLPLLVLHGCASVPTVVKNSEVTARSKIGVILFRDCLIPGQEDCVGSGNVAGSIYAKVLASNKKFIVAPISRPVPSNKELTDDEAIEIGKKKLFDYVINGEVTEYFDVAPMTFRSEKAGVSLRIIKVNDGSIIAFQNDNAQTNNLRTPQGIIEGFAKDLLDEL